MVARKHINVECCHPVLRHTVIRPRTPPRTPRGNGKIFTHPPVALSARHTKHTQTYTPRQTQTLAWCCRKGINMSLCSRCIGSHAHQVLLFKHKQLGKYALRHVEKLSVMENHTTPSRSRVYVEAKTIKISYVCCTDTPQWHTARFGMLCLVACLVMTTTHNIEEQDWKPQG